LSASCDINVLPFATHVNKPKTPFPTTNTALKLEVTFCVQWVASPLLANIYMNRFLKHWRLSRCGEAFRAHVVSYADDFVILSRGRAAEALTWTKAVMTKLGLTLNEAKTSLKDARRERFDLLGYSFWPAPSIQPESAYVPVYECEPLEEERATAQGQSGRAAGISYRAHSRLYQG
jgi:hypothetical protein